MLRREEVERIKEQYPKGTPIRLYSMEGEQTVPPGSRGIVDHVDDIGQIHMKWENGSSLALNLEVDRFEIITQQDDISEKKEQEFIDKVNEILETTDFKLLNMSCNSENTSYAAEKLLAIRTREEVNLIYLAAGEKDYRNESREFMLKRAGENPLEELQSGETELKLPPQLLADAHIPLDADLDIVCLDRKIVILPTEDVESEEVPKELLNICAELGIPREKVNIVLRMTEEGSDEKAGV